MSIKGLEKILVECPKLIKNMRTGHNGYAVPWACVILKNGDVYLNGVHTVSSEKHGTACLYVEKTEQGYDLDFSNVYRFDDYYDTLEQKISSVMGSKKEDWIKVGNITDEYKRSQIQ